MIELTIQLLGFIAAALLIVIGIAGMVFLDNMIKKIIAFTLLSDGVNLLLVAIGYIEGGVVPILLPDMSITEFTMRAALVFPVGIVLTNIVIGVSTTAILVSLVIMLYRRYGTLKASVILKGEKR